MPGRGRTPKPADQRRTRHTPQRGDWEAVQGTGWAFGPVPAPPVGLLPASRNAWKTWMGAWFASHWTPDDLPGLRIVAMLYDQVERGEFSRVTELRQLMDNYGISKKGQQDRRWAPPKADEHPEAVETIADSPYGHLRAVV